MPQDVPLVNLSHMEQLAEGIRNDTIVFPASHTLDSSGYHQLTTHANAAMIRWKMSTDFLPAMLDHPYIGWKLNGQDITLRYNDGSLVSPGTLCSGELLMGEVNGNVITLTIPPPTLNANRVINGDFRGTINQKMYPSYQGGQYTIDDWYMRKGSNRDPVLNVLDGSIQIVSEDYPDESISLNQTIEDWQDLVGKEVTVSILIKENTSGPFRFGLSYATSSHLNQKNVDSYFTTQNGVGLFCYHTKVRDPSVYDMTLINFCCPLFTGESVNVKLIAVKLEEGKKQTLAHLNESGEWVPNVSRPNINEELNKCERYQFVPEIGTTFGCIGYGCPYPTLNHVRIYVPCPVQMMRHPTVSFTGNLTLMSDPNVWTTFVVENIEMETRDSSKYVIGLKVYVTNLDKIEMGKTYYLRSGNDRLARVIFDANNP